MIIFLKKIIITLRNIKSVAYHHYGSSPLSVFKFIYYSLFSINKFYLYEIDMYKYSSSIQKREDLVPVHCSVEELKLLREKKELPREFYCDEVYGYKKCFVALVDGNLAYIHWVVSSGDYNRFLVLPDDVVGFHYMTTLQQYRGKSISAFMLGYAARFYKDMGYRKIVSVISCSNPPACKSAEKVGYVKVTTLKSYGLFNFKYKVK